MRMYLLKQMSIIARTIKDSLAMVIPVLFIGAIMVLLNGFPVQAYQDFLDSYLNGALRSIMRSIDVGTNGVLAIYITIAVNLSYMNKTGSSIRLVFRFGSLLASLTGFGILVGLYTEDKDVSMLSGQGVFSAIVAGLVGAVLFTRFLKVFKTQKMILVDGADSEFNAALHAVLPLLCVTLCFAVVNYLTTVAFQVNSLQHLFVKLMNAVFLRMRRSYFSGLLFVFLSCTMWWFGIHGNNVLEKVAWDMFVTIIPGEIVSKSFIDTFVHMGGTGCTIGLLLALLLFARTSSAKKLSGLAFLPGIFNIGELLVFGFPVVYNPLMIVPFILAPLLCYTNAFLLTKLGFMPMVTREVVWTTPALMSGFIATGSARGMLVQFFNILISTCCYAPFMIHSEKRSMDEFSSSMDELVGHMKRSEESGKEVILTEGQGKAGHLAKLLATDLEVTLSAMESDLGRIENPLRVDLQKRFDDSGKCVGARAEMKWEHSLSGLIYPPLCIRIAGESGDLFRLETGVIEMAIRQSRDLSQSCGEGFKLEVSVTSDTLRSEDFITFLKTMVVQYKLRTGDVRLTVTGDMGVAALAAAREIRQLGFECEAEEK